MLESWVDDAIFIDETAFFSTVLFHIAIFLLCYIKHWLKFYIYGAVVGLPFFMNCDF